MKKIWVVLLLAFALLVGACGGDEDDSANGDGNGGSGDSAAGEEVYSGTCASCHGANLEGGVGLKLDGSQFVIDSTEEELVAFVKEGRPASDPDNQTGTDMPAKGGNPSLTDEDIASVVAYIKSVNE